MRPSTVVEAQIAADGGEGFRNAGVGVQVNLFAYAALLTTFGALSFSARPRKFFERSVIA